MKDILTDIQSQEVSDEITFLISPLLNLYKQNIDRILQPYNISYGQPPLLLLLMDKDGQRQSDLAKQLNVKPSSLTGMIKRMEKTNLVERKKSALDQRETYIFLTGKGRDVCKKVKAVIKFLNARNLAGFRSEERILFLRFIEHMYRNLKKQNEELILITKNEKKPN